MSISLTILQLNVRGLINPHNLTQQQKCSLIYQYIQHHKIDIVLLQEWSLIRTAVTLNNPTVQFPIDYFTGFNVHHIGTESAILYKENFDISPLNSPPNYDQASRNYNFHIC